MTLKDTRSKPDYYDKLKASRLPSQSSESGGWNPSSPVTSGWNPSSPNEVQSIRPKLVKRSNWDYEHPSDTNPVEQDPPIPFLNIAARVVVPAGHESSPGAFLRTLNEVSSLTPAQRLSSCSVASQSVVAMFNTNALTTQENHEKDTSTWKDYVLAIIEADRKGIDLKTIPMPNQAAQSRVPGISPISTPTPRLSTSSTATDRTASVVVETEVEVPANNQLAASQPVNQDPSSQPVNQDDDDNLPLESIPNNIVAQMHDDREKAEKINDKNMFKETINNMYNFMKKNNI